VPSSFAAEVRKKAPSLTDEQVLKIWKNYK
jgi:hypothetical protein